MVEIYGCNFSFATAVLKPTGVLGVIEYPLMEWGGPPRKLSKIKCLKMIFYAISLEHYNL